MLQEPFCQEEGERQQGKTKYDIKRGFILICECVFSQTRSHTHIYVCRCVGVRARVCIHTLIHKSIHTHICMNVYKELFPPESPSCAPSPSRQDATAATAGGLQGPTQDFDRWFERSAILQDVCVVL